MTHLNLLDQELLENTLRETRWLPGIHAGTIAINNIVLFKKKKDNICDVLNSVLSCISGLCTTAVELRKDITFTLNSEIQ